MINLNKEEMNKSGWRIFLALFIYVLIVLVLKNPFGIDIIYVQTIYDRFINFILGVISYCLSWFILFLIEEGY